MEESQKTPKPGNPLTHTSPYTHFYSPPEKVFSYLSTDELEKLKAEEERKIANLSAADINMLHPQDHSDTESVDSQLTG